MSSQNTALELQVVADDRNYGEARTRLSPDQCDKLGVVTGGAVDIVGTEDRTITLRVYPPRRAAETENSSIALTDEQRASLGVEVGDTVQVKQSEGGTPRDVQQKVDIDEELKRLSDQTNGSSTDVPISDASETSGSSQPNTDDSDDIAEDTGGVTYDDVGGLDDEIRKIREMIELPLREPELFEEFGIGAPKGVLMHGPPGTGKTLTAKAIANENDSRFFRIEGPEVMSKYKGESEEEIRRIFREARSDGPAIIFFDEIDAIAPKRNDSADAENRLVAQLLAEMDGMQSQENVVVIGATNRVDALDPALRRGGRFDRELEIGVPDEKGRLDILEVLTDEVPKADDVSLEQLAARTHGFVGADLAALVREAALDALQRVENSDGNGERVVRMEDFNRALTDVEASAMREMVSESPTTTFDDVGGLEDVKERLGENVELPVKYSSLLEAADSKPPAGILLHGPQGTGKTLLARAAAGESNINYMHVRGPELVNKYVGESAKSVREYFDKARQVAPTILFFDEIDAIAADDMHEVNDRIISQISTEMDRLRDNPNVTVIGATEEVDAIDDQLLGSGRFEEIIELTYPDADAREEILEIHLGDAPLEEGVDVEGVAEMFDEETTGADIEAAVRNASMRSVRRVAREVDPDSASEETDRVTITEEDLRDAIDEVMGNN